MEELIRLATAAHDAGKHSRLTDRLLMDGLFTTLTNVNFDDEAIREFTDRVVKEKMPGRNDPCPCGSGKKFKNCHGRGLV